MTRTLAFGLLLSALMFVSCTSTTTDVTPVVPPNVILKDIVSFLTYRQKYVRLSEKFTAIDNKSVAVDRSAFFRQLSSGNYLPLRLITKDSTACYQLFPLGSVGNDDIRQTLKQWGEHLYALYQMEGKELPRLNFVDLNGKAYTKENTWGKIVVVKCWFIGCVPCVKEMPDLNKLVNEFSDRQDVVFVSLAFDTKEALKPFLKAFPFNYAVVPDQKSYIIDTLKVDEFPTHILINKQGRIVRVVNDQQELALALRREAAKENL